MDGVNNKKNNMKLVLVGDGKVGKTCLALSYAGKEIQKELLPTIYETYSMTVNVNGEERSLEVHDTAGQEGFDNLRLLAYVRADVIFVCFAIDQESSFLNVEQTWVPEVRERSPDAKIVVVATKSDLRDAEKKTGEKKLISTKRGQRLASDMKASFFTECSAQADVGVAELFSEAISMHFDPGYKPRAPKGQPCVLL